MDGVGGCPNFKIWISMALLNFKIIRNILGPPFLGPTFELEIFQQYVLDLALSSSAS